MNNFTKDSQTSLHVALEQNNIDQLKSLLTDKNNVQYIDVGDKNGLTPLMIAAKGNPLAVKILLDNDANPHIREKNKNLTALLIAIAYNQIEIVEMLLNEKTITDSSWILMEALNFAAKEGQYDIVKILLEKYHVQDCPDQQGFTAIDYARFGGNPAIVQIIQNHFNHNPDPEHTRFIKQAKMIKSLGQIFSLSDVISIKTPNSKNYIHMKTEGDLPLNVVSLLAEELNQYLKSTPLETNQKQRLEKILNALLKEQQYLQAEDADCSEALSQEYHQNNLIMIPLGWQDHMMVEVALKNRIALCNEGRGLLEGGTKIFNLIQDITPNYIKQVKSTKCNDDSWKIYPRICEIFDPQKPVATLLQKNKKSKDYTYLNLLASIEAMLYLLTIDEYETLLQSNDENVINRLHQEGIYNFHDAKTYALKSAKKAKNHFIRAIKDTKLKELLNNYLNRDVSLADKKIILQLLTKILADFGQKYYHRPKTKMDIEINRAKFILTSLSEEDRFEILENLNKDKIDILALFIHHHERPFVELLLNYGANLGLCLRQAISINNISVVKEILHKIKGDKINEADEIGQTALHLAVKKGYHAIVELLLQFGADPTISNQRTKETPIQIAKAKSDNNMMTLLSLEWREVYRPTA